MTSPVNQSDDRQDNADEVSKAREQVAAHSECKATEASQLSDDDL